MSRDSRIPRRRPQIRNFGPPKEDGPGEDDETPWDRLGSMLAALEEQRTQRLLDHVKEACYDRRASFREVTWTAFEAITEATNEELRQVLTTVQHRLQLSLMQTDPGEPPLTREEAWELLDAVEQGSTLLDAQAPRDEIASAFLDLDPEPVELSDLVRKRLERYGLAGSIETSFEPAPVRVDRERFGEAVIVLVETFLERSEDEDVVLRVRWEGPRARVFVGTRPPAEPKHELQRKLNRRASIRDPDLDLPLARAVVQHHEGAVRVHETDDGAIGFCCELRALHPGLSLADGEAGPSDGA